MGFVASLSKGWSFMRAAFGMARDNKKLLAPSLYLMLVTIAYFIAWVGALVAIDPHWSNGEWTAVSAVATFGSFLIFYFFCGITVNMIDVHLKGGTPSVGDGARDAAKNLFAIVVLAVVSTVVDLFVSSLRRDRSILGRIVAGIVDAVWTTLTFLLLPAIIIEDAGFGEAMRRVRALHKGNLMLIGVGEVGVRAITGLVGLLWFALTFGVLYLTFTALHGTAALVVGFVLGGALLAVFAAFATYLRMAYYTCLYLWAADVEKQGAHAPAPLPLAIALGQRRAALAS